MNASDTSLHCMNRFPFRHLRVHDHLSELMLISWLKWIFMKTTQMCVKPWKDVNAICGKIKWWARAWVAVCQREHVCINSYTLHCMRMSKCSHYPYQATFSFADRSLFVSVSKCDRWQKVSNWDLSHAFQLSIECKISKSCSQKCT